MPKKPDILSTSITAESRLFQIEQVHLRFENGEERLYERMKGRARGAVVMVPILNDDTLLLIREYGCGVHDYYLSLPVGAIDASDQDPLQAANRELKEEVGYGSNKLTQLRDVSTGPGYSTRMMHVLLAEELYEERLPGDEPEPIEVVPWPLAKLTELYNHPEFYDAKCIAAIAMVQEHLRAKQ